MKLLHQVDALAPHKVWGKRARALLTKVLRREPNAPKRKRLARRSWALAILACSRATRASAFFSLAVAPTRASRAAALLAS